MNIIPRRVATGTGLDPATWLPGSSLLQLAKLAWPVEALGSHPTKTEDEVKTKYPKGHHRIGSDLLGQVMSTAQSRRSGVLPVVVHVPAEVG